MMGKVVLALALIAVCASADFSDEYVPETELAEHHVGLKLHKHVGLTIKHKPSAAPVVYQHCNFGGYKKVLHHSTNWVRKLGIKNDDLSSIKVPACPLQRQVVEDLRNNASPKEYLMLCAPQDAG